MVSMRSPRAMLIVAVLGLTTIAASAAEQSVISNRGNKKALPKTPLAVYQKQVTDLIGSRWYAYTKAKMDLLSTGTLEMTFRVQANGRVTGLKVLSNTSNEAFAQICRAAVLDSKFPPIPDAVRKQLALDYLDWEAVKFTLYPD